MNEDAEPAKVEVGNDPESAWAWVQGVAIVVVMIGVIYIEPIQRVFRSFFGG